MASVCCSGFSLFKVVVLGAAGGIGQSLSQLLKLNPLVSELVLYDIAPVTPGVAKDLSHMDTPAQVTGFRGPESLPEALRGAHVVVVPAGQPRKPGMTRDDLFNTNASIVRDLSEVVAKNAPKAILAIITNPVNSMVPIAAEVYKKAGVFDPNRVIGVTTLDVCRSNTFIGQINGVDPRNVNCPVIGGHAGVTIIPVLSQAKPPPKITDQSKIMDLTKKIQGAGTEVVKAKAGGGSATLAMGWAGAMFTDAILRGLNGQSNVIECAYVKSNVSETSYFANPIMLGKNGVVRNLGYGKLNEYEQSLLTAAIPIIKKNIARGVEFVNKDGSGDRCNCK